MADPAPHLTEAVDFRFTNIFSDTLWLYFAVTGQGPNQKTDRRLAFVPAASPATPPPPLSLVETWKIGGGVCLFLGQRIVQGALFIARLRVVLSDPALTGAKLLWILNPNDPVESWRIHAVQLTSLSDRGGILSNEAFFGFRNYGLRIGAGTELTVVAEPPSFRLGPSEGPPSRTWFTARDGAAQLPILTGPVHVPLSGGAARALRFSLSLPPQGETLLDHDTTAHTAERTGGRAEGSQVPEAVIDQLDVGCRFFYFLPGFRRAGLLTSQRYPLFDTSSAPLLLDASLDPLAPLDPDRTYFTIPTTPAFPSYYRSNLGKPLELTSKNGSLVFALKPGSLASAAAEGGAESAARPPFYLVPRGQFKLAPSAQTHMTSQVSSGPDLLCGVAGAEYIELPGEGSITFIPGQAAFAPYFEPAGTDAFAAGRAPLTLLATTSWAALSDPNGGELTYRAQPQESILYGLEETRGLSAQGSFLYYFPLTAGLLPPTPTVGASYPLVPYAGLDQSLKSYLALESEALSPQRRAVIYELGKQRPEVMGRRRRDIEGVDLEQDPCADPDAERAVTPQGFVGVFNEDRSVWQCLQLANNENRTLAFGDVQGPLRAALLTNQQFLVITNPNAFAAYLQTNSEISIKDWLFQLTPSLWGRHGTVVIVKNHQKSLRELALDTSTWSLAKEFNTFPNLAQRRLLDLLEVPEDSDFDHFRHLVDDPNWNGTLFLNAFVPLAGLPTELRGLAAGIDPENFFAHHLGINQTAVEGDGQEIRKSSLFGLIFHHDALTINRTATYSFQVLQLVIRFANSEVAAFASRIAVTLNQLFSSAAVQQDAADNAVLLDGVYQKHGDSGAGTSAPAYVFSLVKKTKFEISDAVLTGVEIERARFSTLTEGDQGGEGGEDQVQSRFSFWGAMSFAALEGGGEASFDVFSYDALAFADLRLAMSFPSGTPAARRLA
ncbi:MAG: hypothetical protein AAFY88_02325, partial [Acidobacteriota bacterium]